MNKERILEMADDLENDRYRDVGITEFNMNYLLVTGDCGTMGCLAGFAAVKYTPKMEHKDPHGGVFWNFDRPFLEAEERGDMVIWRGGILATAMNALDIEWDIAGELFYPSVPSGYSTHRITPQQAAKVLRHLAETGEVIWERVLNDGDR